jgi:hypothetical protein
MKSACVLLDIHFFVNDFSYMNLFLYKSTILRAINKTSVMLHRVVLVKTDVSEELSARATWRNIPEDAIFHNHRSEKLRSEIKLVF